eukprot:5242351-Amphidinium_carterae.1
MEVRMAEAADACDDDEIASNPSKISLTTGRRRPSVLSSGVSTPTMGLTWEHEFYRYLNLRLNGLIFLRAQARTTISIAVALSYICMGFVIRATPSREVLNF